MPIYEYACAVCGARFELMAAVADAPPVRGPACETGACKVQKRFGPVAGHVRGVRRLPEPPGVVPSAPPGQAASSHVCAKYCDHPKK